MTENSNNPSEKSLFPRITYRHLFEEFLDVINFERGFLYTIKRFILNPREAIEEYFYTDRLKHANPIRFLIFSTAIYAFLQLSMMGSFGESVIEGFKGGFDLNNPRFRAEYYDVESVDNLVDKSAKFHELEETIKEETEKATDVFAGAMDFIYKHSDILTFTMVPIYSFFTFLFYRKARFNFPEHLVVNSYMTSIQNTFAIIMMPIALYDYFLMTVLVSIPYFIFIIYYWVSMFKANSGGGVIKAMLAVILSYVTYFTLMFGILVFLIMKGLNIFD